MEQYIVSLSMTKRKVIDLNFETDYYQPPSPDIDTPSWQERIIESCTYELTTTNEITIAMDKFIENASDADDATFRESLLGDRYHTLRERKQMLLLTLLDTAKVLL